MTFYLFISISCRILLPFFMGNASVRRHLFAVFATHSCQVFALVFLDSLTRMSTKKTMFAHTIIVIMEVSDILLYKERWKTIEEIELQELCAVPSEEHWRKLSAIVRFAIETVMEQDNDDGEREVFLRWARLKAQYEAG